MKPPIFIAGCGHSGTSLMLAILDYHSSIYAIPYESHILFKQKSEVINLSKNWNLDCVKNNKHRWAEKTPIHIYKLDVAKRLFTGCKIILMLRDGRDVVYSLVQRGCSLSQAIDRWATEGHLTLCYKDCENCKMVRYEQLIDKPLETIFEVLDFLEENKQSDILNFHLKERRWYSENVSPTTPNYHQDYRNWQINQPIFDHRGIHKGKLNDADLQFFYNKAGSLLEKLKVAEVGLEPARS